ncbi:MAG: hypothetical protein ABEH64_12120 [Salinirussus sp.]
MNVRQLFALLLAAGLLIPAAGVTAVAQENSTPAPPDAGDSAAGGDGAESHPAN